MSFAPSLSVVVPAYNEAANLPTVIADLRASLPATCAVHELVVVDDGSRDDSANVLARLAGPDLRVFRHARNQGLSGALRTGFYGARHDFITWVPADGQIPAPELVRILDAWRGQDLLLSTYRHRPDGVARALMSHTLRLMLRASIGLVDRLEGPYLFRRALLESIPLVTRSSAGTVGFELAAKIRARGLSVASTEIECAPRLSGASKVANWRNIATSLVELWRIRASL